MNLYVVRHCQTNSNKNKLFNGRNDEDINEYGIEQAKELKEHIKSLDIDLIVSSPLIRAVHTAKIVNPNSSKIIIDDRIIERDAGELTLKSHSRIDIPDYFNVNPKTSYQDLEPLDSVLHRVYSFLDDIQNNYTNYNNILVVTHGYISRIINTYFNGIPEDGNLLNLRQKNGEIKKYII